MNICPYTEENATLEIVQNAMSISKLNMDVMEIVRTAMMLSIVTI